MSELVIRAILKDEFSAAAQKIIQELGQIATGGATAGQGLRTGMSSALPTVQGVTDALGQQNAQLRAQIAAYKSDAGSHYLQEQKALWAEMDQLTASGQKQGMTWADIASKYYIVSQALGTVANATMAVVDASSRYDSIKVRIDAFEGSAQAGAAALAKLQELAKQPGLGLEQAASAYASLRALKESGPEAVKIIEAIAHANASMGGGAEEFGRAMNQIQQMLGKGKLMAEDINTISESIPNFRALLVDAFGTADTKALNAKLSIQDLLKGIEEVAAKLPAPGETIKNNMDNIGDAWTRLMASIGNTSTIKTATGAIAEMLSAMGDAASGDQLSKAQRWVAADLSNIADLKKQIDRSDDGAERKNLLKQLKAEEVFLERHRANVEALKKDAAIDEATAKWSSMGGSMSGVYTGPGEASQKGPLHDISKIKDRGDDAEQLKKDADKRAKMLSDIYAAEVDAENDRYNETVKRRSEFRAKLETIGAGDQVKESHVSKVSGARYSGYAQIGIQSSQALAADRKADEAYWRDKKKDEDDYRKRFNANQKTAFEAYKRDEEAKTKETEKELKRREALNAAIGGRIADISVQSLMVGFAPLDDIYSRMAARNAEMEDSFTKTFEGIGLAFATMMTKMAEEMATKAAIFGLFSLFGGGGIIGGASSFIFGARASGGAMFPGVPYRFNEDRYGGGGEIFRPASAGTASPERNGGGGGNTMHFHFAAGTRASDKGMLVRAFQEATGRERQRSVARGF